MLILDLKFLQRNNLVVFRIINAWSMSWLLLYPTPVDRSPMPTKARSIVIPHLAPWSRLLFKYYNFDSLQEEAAVRLAELVGYRSTGTVEYLYDVSGKWLVLDIGSTLKCYYSRH